MQVSPTQKTLCFSNWDEWMVVRHGLYSTVLAEQENALRIVSIWRQRRDIPHSVDSTAHFVEIKLKDSHFSSSPASHTSSSSLVMLYSITIIRAVNGLVDAGQQSFFAQSVLSMAERLGIPGWIVELRHDGTHKALPSISVLRAATQYLLDWYDKHYWTPQLENLQNLTRFVLTPMLSSSNIAGNDEKEMDREREQWTRQLVQFSVSASFVSDLFLPIFVDAVLGESATTNEYTSSISTNSGPTAQKMFEHAHALWRASIDALVENHGAVWLFAAIARFLHVMDTLLTHNESDKDSTMSLKSELVCLWTASLCQRLTRELKQHTHSELCSARAQFIHTQWQCVLCTAQHHGNKKISALQAIVVPFLNKFERNASKKRQREVHEDSQDEDDDLDSVEEEKADKVFSTVCYAELEEKPLDRIVACEAFPVWPLGYLPGRYECIDLLFLEDIEDER